MDARQALGQLYIHGRRGETSQIGVSRRARLLDPGKISLTDGLAANGPHQKHAAPCPAAKVSWQLRLLSTWHAR